MAMPTIPTAAEIRARIISDLEAAFNQTTPALPKSFNRVLAGAVAGFVLLCYQAILWGYAQIFPDRADRFALVLLAKLVGITPTGEVAAKISADVAGTNGQTVLEGTLFTAPNGYVYKVTTGGLIALGVADCELTCLTAGDAGNLADGVLLSIVSADPNLTGAATVTGTVTTGADAETLEHLRDRVVARYKKRTTGGSPADYELWGLETPHFVWVSPYTGIPPVGVIVYGKVDNQTDGIPTAAQLLELASYLDEDPDTAKRHRKPITDEVECLPISRFLFDVAIKIKDGTSILKANIETAIEEYLESLEPYNEGVSAARIDTVTESGVASVAVALAQEAGATILETTITETLTGTSISGTGYVLYGGEFAKMNSCAFTDVV
ncbi:MAG: baseplate J/gp47 family protein [Spirochaetes bacterium]|nr:baseplate J/gp47 family protein [Spirochaetota bacterium]